MRKFLLRILGILSLTLGIVGIFVPLLPTTPLLLLAAACFMRSSEKLHHWLMNHPWLGSYIRHYREYRAVTLRTKVTTLVVLWLTIGYAVIFVLDALALRILLLGIAVGVTIHLVSLKTLTKEMLKKGPPLSEAEKQALLCHAPYDYVHWQGEDGYRIWDRRTREVVGFAGTSQDAKAWIIDRWLKERATERHTTIAASIEASDEQGPQAGSKRTEEYEARC